MATASNYATLVQELYVAYFGRPADPTGMQNFELALSDINAPTTITGLLADYGTNATVTALINNFGNSTESGKLYGNNIAGSLTVAQGFVTAVFESLFNRAPLTAGLAFWSEAIVSGSLTPGAAALSIAAGAGTADSVTLNNKIAAASVFTGVLVYEDGSAGTVYQGAVAAAEARAFLASVDNTTSGASFTANATTLVNSLIEGSSSTTTPPLPPTPTVTLTVAGDSVQLNHTTAASNVNLTGADLTAYPAARFGTVAGLVSAGTTSVADTSGNFTLDASGNSSSTTFNFGTGAVSGSDPASSAGITYAGVTTYITSAHYDTVTLSAATQNVTASNDGNTVNLGSLAYAGTLNFTAGSGGTDTINATVGGNLGGATIDGTSSSVAKIALVLSAAGNETLSTAEYNTITGTTGGSITFTGGSFGTDTITFSSNGTVSAISSVGNYDLSTNGNTITLNSVADNVNGAASGNDIVNLAALTYTGTLAFGAAGSDSVHVTVGGDISGGTITSGGATVALVLSAAGTETMTVAEYNLFNATNISGGTSGSNTITFSGGGTVTANTDVGNYDLSTAGNTITLTSTTNNVSGAASGNDIVNLAALTYAGTTAFGASGSDAIHVTVGGNISGGTITTTGATVALVLSASGTETLNVTEYNLFNAASITGGTFGGDTITFSNSGTVTANANVGNYDLSNSGTTTIHLNNVGDNVTAGSGVSAVNMIDLAALTYAGTLNFGGNSTDFVDVTVGGNISGATMNASGAQVTLMLSGSGTETLSTEEYNLFNASGGIGGGSAGSNTIVFSDLGTVADNSDVGNYDLSTAGNTLTLTSTTSNVNGAASGNDIVAIPQFSYTGTLAFGATGTDIVQDPTNGDFSGLTITSGGAMLELMITGVASGVPSGSSTTTEVYNEFTTGPHAGGIVFPTGGDTNPADYIMAFSDQGTVTDSAKITNYYLNAAAHSTVNDIYTFTIAHNSADNITEYSGATGGSTFNMNVSTFTGHITLGGSGNDTIVIPAGNNISGGTITRAGSTASLTLTGSGTTTISSAEAALFHAAPSAISASGANTLDIADANTSPLNLSAQENAVTTIGLQAGNNTVNVSVGAANVNSGAAGFNQTIQENGAGNNTFNIDNGGAGATIVGASDNNHYVTINNFNTTSDNINLTLSNNAQSAGEQDISDTGHDTVTVGVNGVIVETNLGNLSSFVVGDANNLADAKANILSAINASTATSGEYTFVIDTNEGAAIYEIHVNNASGGSIDGIQLIAVVHGVGALNLTGHIA